MIKGLGTFGAVTPARVRTLSLERLTAKVTSKSVPLLYRDQCQWNLPLQTNSDSRGGNYCTLYSSM